MKIGILKEIKIAENRVALTPAGAEILSRQGHEVLLEKNAGIGSGFTDSEYSAHGSKILSTKEEIFREADLLLHVKEPQTSELALLRKDQILFTFLHLAASKELTQGLLRTNSICFAYETVQKEDGSLPLLTPMSEIAGRMAAQEGAKYLQMIYGGNGTLLGGVPGVEPGVVLVLGGGTVGTNAASIASGLGARVYVLDTSLERLRYLSEILPKNCIPVYSSPSEIRRLLQIADLVIGAVLLPGAKAPRLITKEMLGIMKKGAVLLDVSIDQGGCFETSRATTHQDPVYIVDGIVHYAVSNMPGAVPKTSTIALTNATLPYILQIANLGWKEAIRKNKEILNGANVVQGKLTYQAVAETFDLEYSPALDF